MFRLGSLDDIKLLSGKVRTINKRQKLLEICVDVIDHPSLGTQTGGITQSES